MTKAKNYKFGKYTFKAYCKATGKGWEVGFVSGSKYYFVGNFIREKEAKQWWTLLNKYIATFANNYEFYSAASKDFYGEFMAAYLYKGYYQYLSSLFVNYNSFYAKDYEKFNAKYEKYSRSYAA